MVNMLANFKLFGVSHIVLLIFAIVIAVGFFFLFRKYFGNSRKILSIVLIALSGALAILEFVGRALETGDILENLPLAPWQVFIYIGIFVEITKRPSWIKFGYLITVPLCAIGLFVVPNYYTTIGLFSLPVICYFFGNAIIILYSLLQMVWSEEFLYKKDIFNITMNYIIIIAFAHIFNVFMSFIPASAHVNYFGTMGENYDAIMKLLYGVISVPFVHILPLIVVIIGLEFLMLLPYDMKTSRKAKREHIEELVALGNLKAQQDARKGFDKGGSQILVRSENKAQPQVQKNVYNNSRDGFVSVNKTIQTHKDDSNK
jgi:hypothetical protein